MKKVITVGNNAQLEKLLNSGWSVTHAFSNGNKTVLVLSK